MIIAERKPFNEIKAMVDGCKKILVAGCGTCVTVCLTGGEKEVGLLASELKLASRKEGKEIECVEITPQRQCEKELVRELKDKISSVDAVLSMACGVGVQTIVEEFPKSIVYPALNTKFYGMPEEQGVWKEMCLGCGNCILHLTAGVCPIARCSKSLLNGPCGGSANGKCEVDPQNIPCGWQLIYDRMEKLGQLNLLEEIIPIKDWSTSQHGGVRKIVREDIKL